MKSKNINIFKMELKAIILLSLLMTVTLANDDFLPDNEFNRFLTTYTAAKVTTTCSSDSSCWG